jgi:hypothetical protein
MFFFGAEPAAPLPLFKPIDVRAVADGLIICDGALRGIVRCDGTGGALEPLWPTESPRSPAALAVAPNGDRLIADAAAGVVTRFDSAGGVRVRYVRPSEDSAFRPGGVACVGDDEVWVSNVAEHRVEVFDAASGQYKRSIGRRGRGPGEFGVPLGIAAMPDASVAVVDMLGARIQVLDRAGNWVRDIGGPGDRVGYFGRPRDIAIGPDGTIFVTDAASQRVHAFASDGRPLLAFGGPSDGADALVLPAGIAVCERALAAAHDPPAGFTPSYYVLVAEQLARPGIRVYAWRPWTAADTIEPERFTLSSARRAVSTAANPHWKPESCGACHALEADRVRPIEPQAVDALCLSCHDGKRASEESHPVGWPAAGPRTRAPEGWPLVDGRIGCLTCHDIRRHCDVRASRPAENPALVRGFNPRDAAASCMSCHVAQTWRINPHLDMGGGAGATANGCAFCHTSRPPIPSDGRRRFDARLREESSRLCLNCHTMHADPAPEGHLDALAPDSMVRTMLAREKSFPGQTADAPPEGILEPGADRPPALLPLEDGRVECYSCHNPHPPGLFPSGTVLGARSASPADEKKSLRMDQIDLCRYCHPK